jgi:hypothetical protein
VMTLPDLGNLWLKRSVRPVHYIYLFHSINSTHTAYRKGAFDGFDTILCVGPHHIDEIRKTEALYDLAAKELVEHGSAKLDTVLAQFADAPASTMSDAAREVLVAPTWGDSSLIERPVGRELIAALLRAGHRTVLRLHPMTVRRLPKLIAELRHTYRDEPHFRLEDDMNVTESWLRSDLMISDWSGAAIEYAFAVLKPVIYVDTPAKILNDEWNRVGSPSFEAGIRHEVGRVVEESAIGAIPDLVEEVARSSESMREWIRASRDRSIFNIGNSSSSAAAYLMSLVAAS